MADLPKLELHFDPAHPDEHRVVLDGQDLTRGIRAVSIDITDPQDVPTVAIEPLVAVVRSAISCQPEVHLDPDTRLTLIACGWSPPATADEPTDACDGCSAQIDRGEPHVTVMRQVERLAGGAVNVSQADELLRFHARCAPRGRR